MIYSNYDTIIEQIQNIAQFSIVKVSFCVYAKKIYFETQNFLKFVSMQKNSSPRHKISPFLEKISDFFNFLLIFLIFCVLHTKNFV